MKKVIGVFAIAIILVSQNAEAQSFSRLKQAASADTIVANQTIFTSIVNVNTNDLQGLSLQVAMDSVKGTPDAKFVLQRSVDGIHWLSLQGDTLIPVYNGKNTVAVNSKQININPYYGTYARVKMYTSSVVQKSNIWVAIRTATIR